MWQFPGSDADFSEQERFISVSSESFSREFQARQDRQEYSQDDIRDCWLTLMTAMVLGGLSLVLIVMGIVKFSVALKMTTQSTLIDVPESIKREALNYIR